MVLHDLVTLTSTPMSAHPPMSVPNTRARLIQLIRRGSISLGTSTPALFAPSSRTAARIALRPRSVRAARGSSAARWRNGSAATSSSDRAVRTAAATARSGPTTSAVAARVAARSRSNWSGVATVAADRMSMNPDRPSSASTIDSVESEPWVMPAARRVRT